MLNTFNYDEFTSDFFFNYITYITYKINMYIFLLILISIYIFLYLQSYNLLNNCFMDIKNVDMENMDKRSRDIENMEKGFVY